MASATESPLGSLPLAAKKCTLTPAENTPASLPAALSGQLFASISQCGPRNLGAYLVGTGSGMYVQGANTTGKIRLMFNMMEYFLIWTWHGSHSSFCLISDVLFKKLIWGRERKGERETSSCCFIYLYIQWLILVRALPGNRTPYHGVLGQNSKQLSRPARVICDILLCTCRLILL